MALWIYLVLIGFSLCYLWIKKRYSYWTDKGFISAPASFPFGTIKGVGTEITNAEGHDIFYKKYKGKGPVVGTYIFLQPVLLTTDPEFMKNILVRDFTSFHDRGFYYNKESDPLSANILSLEGQEWRERRVKLSPIFTSGKMKMMFDIVNIIGDKFVNIIKREASKSNIIEMRSWAAKYTADVIGNVAFGLECNCLEDPNSEFFKHGRRVFDVTPFELLKFFFSSGYPELAKTLNLRQNPKEPTDFFKNTFLQTLEYREKNAFSRVDFVQLLLGLKDSFTPLELAAESFLVYVAGFETSSTLMTFTMYELALNLDIQEKLRDEIKTAIQNNDGKLTYDMLFDLEYLDQVIKESLRKYPPIPDSVRKCTNEYKIPGTNLIIPKGTTLELPIYSFHHDPEYFPDPKKFDPERFSPQNENNRHSFVYLPFGDGPRNCLGMRFGLMQSKLGIVKLLMSFEISPSDKTPIPMKFVPSAPFLAPVGGMWLNVRKLSD